MLFWKVVEPLGQEVWLTEVLHGGRRLKGDSLGCFLPDLSVCCSVICETQDLVAADQLACHVELPPMTVS